MTRFQNRTIVVTGGNSGIGRATAEQLAQEGANVHIIDRAVDVTDTKTLVKAHQLDARDEDALSDAISEITAEHGSIDGLVNAVGIEYVKEITSVSSADWDRVIDTNLKSYFLAIRAITPYMRDRGGVIVNVASQLALVGAKRFAPYTASKAGILGLTRSLALELAVENIRVNAVCPGAVDTPLLRRQFEDGDGPQGSLQELIQMHPIGRLGTPQDIASPILFLLSDEARFMTGSSLVVDGGYTAW